MRKMLVAVPCQLVQCWVTEARPGWGGTSGGSLRSSLKNRVLKMRKMFLVTYLTRNERFLRFLLNMYIYFCGIILVTIIEN